jgi:carbamoylphosphate synthase small subunit
VSKQSPAILALADGTVFRGRAFGAVGEAAGELVFNTSMTGYQEILTDPSYEGQLVAMTYPQIGNVGVNREDVESRRPYVRGFVVREYRHAPSNWRAEQPLGDYLAAHGIPGIEGIDTRALVRHLRDHGAQEAVLSTGRSRRRATGPPCEGHAEPGRTRPGSRGDVSRAVRLERRSVAARRNAHARADHRGVRQGAAARGRLRFRYQAEHPSGSWWRWAARCTSCRQIHLRARCSR